MSMNCQRKKLYATSDHGGAGSDWTFPNMHQEFVLGVPEIKNEKDDRVEEIGLQQGANSKKWWLLVR